MLLKQIIFIFLLIPMVALSQNIDLKANSDLNFGSKKNEATSAAIESHEGGIIMLAQRESNGNNGTDGLVVKIDAEQKEVFRKTVGTIDDDQAQHLCEDVLGNILVVGVSKRSELNQQKQSIWLQCISSKGEFVWENELLQSDKNLSIAGLQIIPGSNDISVMAIVNGVLHFIRCDSNGKVQQSSKLDNILDKNNIKNAQALIVDAEIYFYGMLELSKERNCPFLVKVSNGKVLHEITFPDIHAVQIGKMRILDKSYFAMTGSSKGGNGDIKEDIFYIKTDTALTLSRSVSKVFHYFGEDYGMDILPIKSDSLYLLGYSTSHLRGSNTTNYMLLSMDDTGILANEKPLYFGTKQDELGLCFLTKNDGSTWIVGTKDVGNVVKSDKDLNLISFIKSPVGNKATQKEAVLPLVLTRSNNDTIAIAFGKTNLVEFELKNQNTFAQLGYYLIFNTSNNSGRGLRFDERFSVKEVSGLASSTIQIPFFSASDKLQQNKISVTLFNSKNEKIDTLSFAIKLLPAPKTELVLTQHQFEGDKDGKFVKGKRIKINYTIENKGDKDAPQVNVEFAVPEQCRIVKGGSNIVQLLAGQKYEGILEVHPLLSMKTKQLNVKLFIKEKDAKNDLVFNLNKDLEEQAEIIAITNIAPKEITSAVPVSREQKIAIKTETKITIQEPATNTSTTTPVIFVSWPENYTQSEVIEWKFQKFEVNIIAQTLETLSQDNFEVFINGKKYVLEGSKMDEVDLRPNKKKDAFFFKTSVLLSGGNNLIKVKVKKNGFEKESEEITVNYNLRDKGTLYVVAAGIVDGKNSLKFTKKDATDFAALFQKQKGKIYGDVKTIILTTANQTRKDSLTDVISHFKVLNNRNDLSDKDAIVFFISTHGCIGEKKKDFRLKTFNYNPANEENTSLSYKEDIQDELENLPCKKYIFLDACQSGAIEKEYTGGKDDDDELNKKYDEAVSRIKEGSNIIRVLASCSKNQKSYEDAIWENGAFTFAIKKMLSNPLICTQYDTDKDYTISLSELYNYINKEVPELVKKLNKESQNPFMPKALMSENLPFFSYK